MATTLGLLLLLHVASVAATTPWRCVAHGTHFAPVRLNPHGDMECITDDGRVDCLWESHASCLQFIRSSDDAVRAPTTLACGAHLATHWHTTGYDNRSHWCSTSLAMLDPSDPRVYQCHYNPRNGRYIGLHVNLARDVECLSQDGETCAVQAATYDGCMQMLLGEAVASIPLVCGAAEYSTLGHWCNLLHHHHGTLTGPGMSPPLAPFLRGNQVPRRAASPFTVFATTTTTVGFGLTLASFGLFFLCRKATKKPEPRRYLLEKAQALPLVDLSPLHFYRLDQHDVEQMELLGSGAHANVYLGQFKGTRLVAIKKLRDADPTARHMQCFVAEIQLLASFHSPYIVELIGVTWTHAMDVACVMEYMDGGDLRDFLNVHKHAILFPWEDKLHCIQSLVDSLVYLHSFPVVHRDLKSRNILLDSNMGMKLTDFGIAQDERHLGSCRWSAPEVLKLNLSSTAADMYSFGGILSEFDTHQIPYTNVKNEWNGEPLTDAAIMKLVVNQTLTLGFSAAMPPWLADLGQQCLSYKQDARPTAMHVASVIREKMRALAPL
ncbi:Aste57867_9890 [Aphanomyces stellatus]|uniref:Aste57867_9890 protein n=1 Tax=Aphanomyces stellatus TaxID=120398 RepID=A0A485KPB5_9STRA|nr:hypothetical protein As57867_009851 [Aphanomyces stellatus]VFT86769.1 Aste57867_9890 [Aphanomyces stellatus]